MANIHLERREALLLRAVADGKVARHRMRRIDSPERGVDYEQVAGHGPGGLRKAAARLKPLITKQLIVLDRQAPDAASWPWRTTDLGDTVLEILAEQATEAAAERSAR